MYDNYSLAIRWFRNLITNKINNEILLFHFTSTQSLISFKEKIKISHKLNFQTIDLNKLNSTNNLDNSRFLMLSMKPLQINFNNLNFSMIFISSKDFSRKFMHTINEKGNYTLSEENIKKACLNLDKNDPSISNLDFSNCVLQKRDPISILKSHGAYFIIHDLFIIIQLFNLREILLINSIANPNFASFDKQVNFDLDFMLKYKKLTSRLAIYLYKICTFNFSATDTKIGRYYANQLGRKSKLYHLPIDLKRAHNYVSTSKVKVYDLELIKIN